MESLFYTYRYKKELCESCPRPARVGKGNFPTRLHTSIQRKMLLVMHRWRGKYERRTFSYLIVYFIYNCNKSFG